MAIIFCKLAPIKKYLCLILIMLPSVLFTEYPQLKILSKFMFVMYNL